MTLTDAARDAAARLRDAARGTVLQLLAQPDADGVAAAGVLARALTRAKQPFHARFPDPDAFPLDATLDEDDATVRLLVGFGGTGPQRFPRLPGTTFILDDEVPTTDAPQAVQLNPRLAGEPHGGASTATTAYALALALDEANHDLAPLALAGAWHEGQLRPAPTGWNQRVTADAQRRGHLDAPTGLQLDDEPLLDLLAHPGPRLRGALPGGYDAAAAFLRRFDLPPDASPHELDPASQQRLASAVALAHLRTGDPAYVARLFGPVPHARAPPALPLPLLAGLLDAAARTGNAGLALAWILGDEAARSELHDAAHAAHQDLRRQLQALPPPPGDDPLRVVSLPDAAHARALLDFLHHRDPPHAVLAHAPAGDHERLHARAPDALVKRGLDLGRELHGAARTHGGHAAGHAHAASGWVPRDHLTAFLDDVQQRVRDRFGTVTTP